MNWRARFGFFAFGLGLSFLAIHFLSIRPSKTMLSTMKANQQSRPADLEKAAFAGGCFWCMVKPFHKYEGVYAVVSGYTGGETKDPGYEDVSTGRTGHYEAVQIEYDPKQISYADLLEIFWRAIDPTDAKGQFADQGSQYRPAIFYHNEEQKNEAAASEKKLEQSGRFKKKIVVSILPAKEFYPAEDSHQDYYKKHPQRYEAFREASGRAGFIEKKWGKDLNFKVTDRKHLPSQAELKKLLTPLEYEVTQEKGTEPAFHNKYWNNKEPGIYVDVITGKPLFSSLDKYDSGTGWPSFKKPIDQSAVEEKLDTTFGLQRRELISTDSDAHLGHVFKDGPGPQGKRFCINSASLSFIPVRKLKEEGYGQYLKLFEHPSTH